MTSDSKLNPLPCNLGIKYADARRNTLHDYYNIANYTNSLNHPLALLRADLVESLTDIRNSVVIITKSLVFIGVETIHPRWKNDKLKVLKVIYACGSLELLQPYIQHYLLVKKQNSLKHVYYFHADKWHLVPIKRFLKHSSSPQA